MVVSSTHPPFFICYYYKVPGSNDLQSDMGLDEVKLWALLTNKTQLKDLQSDLGLDEVKLWPLLTNKHSNYRLTVQVGFFFFFVSFFFLFSPFFFFW